MSSPKPWRFGFIYYTTVRHISICYLCAWLMLSLTDVYIYIYISLCECVNLTLARLLASWSYSQTQPLLTNLASFLKPWEREKKKMFWHAIPINSHFTEKPCPLFFFFFSILFYFIFLFFPLFLAWIQ